MVTINSGPQNIGITYDIKGKIPDKNIINTESAEIIPPSAVNDVFFIFTLPYYVCMVHTHTVW